MAAIRILIADDHTLVREGLRKILEAQPGWEVIGEGRSNKEIAEILFLSPSTVETHRARIMEKLDVHSAVEIVLYAVRKGIIS